MERRILFSVLSVGERADMLCPVFISELFSNKIKASYLFSLRGHASVSVLRTPSINPRILTRYVLFHSANSKLIFEIHRLQSKVLYFRQRTESHDVCTREL